MLVGWKSSSESRGTPSVEVAQSTYRVTTPMTSTAYFSVGGSTAETTRRTVGLTESQTAGATRLGRYRFMTSPMTSVSRSL